MSFFNKDISRKIANQKLETKLLLSTIGIDLLFLFFFLVAAFSIITSRYHKLLYQSMQSSSSLVSYEFTNRLEDLVTMTNIVRSDSTVQSTLDEIYQPQEDYAVHYYSDIYSALQKHYLEYRQPYLKMAAISCPRFITYTNENIACRPDADLTKELIALAEAGEGSPVWVTSHAEDHGIFLVREIKKIKNLRLDNLGTLIINVNLGDLVTEMSKISNEYKDSYWIIYEKDQLLFSSPELDTEEVQKINDKIKSYAVVTLNGRKYFAIRGTMDINEWNYLHLISYDEVAKSQQMTAFLYVLMLSCGFLCSILMVHVIVRKITRHFDLLLYRMQQFGEDSTVLAEIPYDYNDRTDEIGILHRQFTHMAERIQTLVVENYRQQLLAKDAQLKSLESQMNPHFLYNTLETISSIAAVKQVFVVCDICGKLGEIFRYSLGKNYGELVPLEQEMTHIKNYMFIQKIRYGNRLQVFYKIDVDGAHVHIPRFILQPIVENAISHGLSNLTSVGTLEVSAFEKKDRLYIEIEDDGEGMVREKVAEITRFINTAKPVEGKKNIGIRNVNQRIKLAYGEAYGITIRSAPYQGSRFTIQLPIMRKGEEDET